MRSRKSDKRNYVYFSAPLTRWLMASTLCWAPRFENSSKPRVLLIPNRLPRWFLGFHFTNEKCLRFQMDLWKMFSSTTKRILTLIQIVFFWRSSQVFVKLTITPPFFLMFKIIFYQLLTSIELVLVLSIFLYWFRRMLIYHYLCT